MRVPLAREVAFKRLVQTEPLVVLGNDRVPDILSSSIVPSATTCFGPRGACLTSGDGPLWICDTGHHRLLGWQSLPVDDQTPADWCIGQKDFSCEGRNGKGDVGPATVNVPTGICLMNDGLVVADAWNHRVLIWNEVPRASNTPADIVLGQSDFVSCLANEGKDHPQANTLHWPYGVQYRHGKLFVADTGNRRVLIWNEPVTRNGQPANIVLGQTDFCTRDENAGADPSAMSMRWPHAVTIWGKRLCVTDAGNNRILVWEDCPTESGSPADMVLGQTDSTNVDFNQALYWPRSNTLNMPYGITAHNDWLIVADTANSRILAWNGAQPQSAGSATENATALFGQLNFHEKGDNRWQPAVADSLCWPYGVQVTDSLLVVSDSGNNRVSVWKLDL
ncbi:MAG: NHL repeat-containing protein [Candidatus Obscuribacterales bacterium]